MATTTNYSWSTPDDTALVKDGAAAIRSLGTAIDSTVFTNAGAAIAKTLLDAKGDLIVASAADTAARLAVGTNNFVLTADSTATNGIKWAALPAATATFVGCSLYKDSGHQAVPNDTATAITWENEFFDTDAFHSTSTNISRITIPAGKAGKYLVTGGIAMEIANSSKSMYLRKNGSVLQNTGAFGTTTTNHIFAFAYCINLSEGDYLEMFLTQSSGSNKNVYGGTTEASVWSAQYLGA